MWLFAAGANHPKARTPFRGNGSTRNSVVGPFDSISMVAYDSPNMERVDPRTGYAVDASSSSYSPVVRGLDRVVPERFSPDYMEPTHPQKRARLYDPGHQMMTYSANEPQEPLRVVTPRPYRREEDGEAADEEDNGDEDSEMAGSQLNAENAAAHVPGTVGFYDRSMDEPLRPSRFSGHEMPASVNKMPTPARGPSPSDAALLKRGLKRAGAASYTKRASGPTDPENIRIVNMFDNEHRTWAEIADILNKDRVAAGLKPMFTQNGVHNRYNRNAPILYQAEGKTFVQICKRKEYDERGKRKKDQYVWNADSDLLLVEAVKEVEAKKWKQVAAIFNSRTELDIPKLSPEAIATRYTKI